MAWISIVLVGGLMVGGTVAESRTTKQDEHQREQKAVAKACSLADIMAEVTSRARADAALMSIAKLYKFQNRGRAAEHLTHFLQGGGEARHFPLAQLLSEDAGVRRALVAEWRSRTRSTPRDGSLIPVRQRNYDKLDWWGALGSFSIYYTEVGTMRIAGKDVRVALAYGVNVYRWHPNDKSRITQCVHQAAARLTGHTDNHVPVAKDFEMFADPTHVDMDTGLPIDLPLNSTSGQVMERSMQQVKLADPTYINRDD